MLNILATLRVAREKVYDYYHNGIPDNTEREKKDNKKYITKIYNFFSAPSFIYQSNGIKLYLGNSYNAANFSTLNNLEIDCVMNISNEIPNYFPDNFDYFNIIISDKNNNKIKGYFDKAISFFFSKIEEGNKNFFIHCYYGASRSAIITLLILIRYFNVSFEESTQILHKKRDFVNINVGFLKELKSYLDIEKN